MDFFQQRHPRACPALVLLRAKPGKGRVAPVGRAALRAATWRCAHPPAITVVSHTRTPHGIGLYLAGVQFFFALTWTVYALYLPQLAEQVGLTRKAVPWLLMMDQLIFIVADLAVGLASDRAAALLGRLGRWVLGITLLSATAFVALPWLAPQGSPTLFIAITALWAASSSVLRAPPLTLLGRYVAKPQQPLMLALQMFGLGLAAALSPYLAVHLRQMDPRLPFVLAALALAAVTLGMVAAERALARGAAAASAEDEASSAHVTSTPTTPVRSHASAASSAPAAPGALQPSRAAIPLPGFLLAALLAALAFQVHVFVTQAPLYLRHAAPAELATLMPLFWVGFNLCLWPASALTKRLGALPVMAAGALLAAAAAALAWRAPTLAALVAAQSVAGVAWALLLMAAFSTALWFGHTGREGRFSGALSALLATAALSRLALLTWQPPPQPAAAADWGWLPVLCFLGAASLLWAMWSRARA